MKGKLLNMGEACEFFGVTNNTVKSWVSKGMPYDQKFSREEGKQWLFNSADVMRWREKQAVANAVGDTTGIDFEEAKRRKISAEAGIAEIQLAKDRGEVAALEDIERSIRDDYIGLRQKARTIPQRVAPLLAGLSNVSRIKEILNQEIDDALNALSSQYGSDGRGEDAGIDNALPQVSETTAEANA